MLKEHKNYVVKYFCPELFERLIIFKSHLVLILNWPTHLPAKILTLLCFGIKQIWDHLVYRSCIVNGFFLSVSPTGRGDLPVPGRLQELAHQERQAQLDHHRWDGFEGNLVRVAGHHLGWSEVWPSWHNHGVLQPILGLGLSGSEETISILVLYVVWST